ncbi:WD repeat-containing protein 17-like [Dermacentor silvarum]|uniref:WD repeat-containing protein 17-like n=1 Tax=Dermacentor silvarum TaxID=543639 RepID=UPI00189AA33A|nr:WD repeat-containing protein 17-like [Dermacentor silvarum]
MSSMMRQVGLLAAGCQTWHVNVASFSGHRFAYAATLAVYIYEMDESNGEFKLRAIMAEHKRTVTAIDWHPTRKEWIASGSLDPVVYVWDIGQRQLVASLREPHCLPLLLSWRPDAPDTIAYLSGRGPLHSWSVPDGPREPWREAAQFSSAVTQMTWHPSGKLAMGHQDGSLSVLQSGGACQKHVRLLHDVPPDSEDEDTRSVVALRWDDQSPGYLLAALPSGQLFLLDWSATTELQVLATYACPSRATTVASLAWVPGAAGMFLTGDKACGTLRVWNVSRNTPLENLPLHGSGFRTLCVCTGFPDKERFSAVPSAESVASQQQQQPASNAVRLPPHVRVLCLFADGAVGLYNIRRRSWDFMRDTAHTETIFDCQFKPDNCNLLATAGFDGTLKIWNIETMTAVMTSPPRTSTIYCLSWAPSGQDCVALGTSKDGLLIWDTVKNAAKTVILGHGKETAIYCVAWNQTDSRMIASAGADSTCMVHRADGKLVQTFHHPATVYGCDWNPNNECIIATACDDGVIRVYYLGMDGGVPLKTLEGHKQKAFRVKWSPLRDGVLCSTSDDCTIHVWNYTCESAVRVLRGHQDLTRSVLWSTELSHLLLSGSWDATIRLWDTRDGVCLCLLLDHGADIYALASHPRRPFVVASSSRDSTVRVWSMLPLASVMFLRILCGWDLNSVVAAQGEQPLGRGKEMLCGSAARQLKNAHMSSRGEAALRAWSTFFCDPPGVGNLWDLLSIVAKGEDAQVSQSYKDSLLLHRSHLVKMKASKARELELVTATRFGGTGVGGPSREQSLQQAAQLYLSTGNLRKYCEILTELGAWNEALALAPGVSYQYWRHLAKRRCDLLVSEDRSEAVGLMLALGKVADLTVFLRTRGQAQNAYVLALATRQTQCSESSSPGDTSADGQSQEASDSEKLVQDCTQDISEKYLLEGTPTLAACCHLAVNDVRGALRALMRGNELELALSVILHSGCEEPAKAASLCSWLAWRCSLTGNWELAMDLLGLCDEAQVERLEILAGCGCSMAERNALHEKVSLPSVEECTTLAHQHEKDGDSVAAVQYYVISETQSEALRVGMSYVKERILSKDWTLDSLWRPVRWMQCLHPRILSQEKNDELYRELRFFSAYVGALKALRDGYWAVATPLLIHARELLKTNKLLEPLLENEVLMDDSETITHISTDKRSGVLQSRVFHNERLTEKLGCKLSEEGNFGEVLVAGSHLPRHSDQRRSIFTGKPIQGPVYYLDDGGTNISLSEAIMWARVNLLSPLRAYNRIIPF